jgi:hypothetical protein
MPGCAPLTGADRRGSEHPGAGLTRAVDVAHSDANVVSYDITQG